MTKKAVNTEVKGNKEVKVAALAKFMDAAKAAKVDLNNPAAVQEFLKANPDLRAELDSALEVGKTDPVVNEVTRLIAARGKVNFVSVTDALTAAYENGSEKTKTALKKFTERFDNDYNKVTKYFEDHFKAQGMELGVAGVFKETAYITADALRFSGTTTKNVLYWVADRIEDGTHWLADVIDGVAGERPEARQHNKIENFFNPNKEVKQN